MPYFEQHYSAVRYPVADGARNGLRNAQLGALFGLGAHFTNAREPGLVVMPTGSGKTAVLMLTPFIRRRTRALVLTTSRLVRNQIAEEFKTLDTLKTIGVLPEDTRPPHVVELRHLLHSADDWESLRSADVVVATPICVSPGTGPVPPPPQGLFDMLLVDEAHHAPAATWRAAIDAFKEAEQALFTATPFRHDDREIKGRLVYSYSLRAAFEDGIFGRIRFVPVEPRAPETNDIAIAKAAAALFREDRESRLEHRLMVRTDSKSRADQLKHLYSAHTSLRLRVVHSDLTYATVKKAVGQLRAGDLDGVICVDMLSEGFDFPNLKLAAIHAPHKSLAVTLQFIGRFARTNADNIGEARFVAVPAEIQGEVGRLYDESASWQDIVVDASEQRLLAEEDVRRGLETFAPAASSRLSAEDLSLYALRPFRHVKIYRVADAEDVDIRKEIRLGAPFEVIHQRVSTELSAAVIIGNEQQRPRWTDLEVFNRSEYDLFVVYYDSDSKLLFINASRRSDALYEQIADQYTSGRHKILPLSRINRVLRGVTDAEFFNVGMRNRVHNNNTESYRIITGPRAERALEASDGRLYHRGHVFGKGRQGSEAITLGYSSASKVWSNTSSQIPVLVSWCKDLARRIADGSRVESHPGLDFLSVGDEVDRLPGPVIGALWDSTAFKQHITVSYRDVHGQLISAELTDLELAVGPSSDTEVTLIIKGVDLECEVQFSLTGVQYVNAVSGPSDVAIRRGRDESPLLDYLNNNPPTLFFPDFSSLRGNELFRMPTEDRVPFDSSRIVAIDWHGENVDIEREVWDESHQRNGRLSIHEHLQKRLAAEDHSVVLYDHRSGEIADIITFSTHADERVHVGLYHCKGSHGKKPGDRVEDVYEVSGQVVKSIQWIGNETGLMSTLRQRIRSGSSFVKGSSRDLDTLFEVGRQRGVIYTVFLVQPGISKSALSAKIAAVIAAADDYVRYGAAEPLVLFASP